MHFEVGLSVAQKNDGLYAAEHQISEKNDKCSPDIIYSQSKHK